jgi:hypothetical protein
MNVLRRRINPETFVITKRQLAKYLKTDLAEFGVGKSGSMYFGCIFKAWRLLHQLPPARAMGSRLLHLNSCLPRLESTQASLVSH